MYLVASLLSNSTSVSAQSSGGNQQNNGVSKPPGARLPGGPKTNSAGPATALPGQGAATTTSAGANIGTGSPSPGSNGVNPSTSNAANGSLGGTANLGSQSRLDTGNLSGEALNAAQQGLKKGTAAFQNSATDSITNEDYMDAIHGFAPDNAGIPDEGNSGGSGSGSTGSGGSNGSSKGGSSGNSNSNGSGSGNSSSAQGNPSGGATGSGVFAPSEINPFGRTGARALDRAQEAVNGGAFQNTGINLNAADGVRLFSQPGGSTVENGGGFKNGSPFAPGGRFSGAVKMPIDNQPAVSTFTRNSIPSLLPKGATGQASLPSGGSSGGVPVKIPGANGVIPSLQRFTGGVPGAAAGTKVPNVQPLSGIRGNVPVFSGGGAGLKVPNLNVGSGGSNTPRTSPVGFTKVPAASLQRPNIAVPIRK